MTEEPTEKGESPSDSADTTENIEQSKDLTVQPESTAKPGDIPSTEVSQDDGAVFGVIGIVAAAAVFILLIIILKRRKDEE